MNFFLYISYLCIARFSEQDPEGYSRICQFFFSECKVTHLFVNCKLILRKNFRNNKFYDFFRLLASEHMLLPPLIHKALTNVMPCRGGGNPFYQHLSSIIVQLCMTPFTAQ